MPRILHRDERRQRPDRDDQFQLVGVRPADEFDARYVTSQRNVAWDWLSNIIEHLVRVDVLLVLDCHSGRPAVQAAGPLAPHTARLTVLQGALDAWGDALRPVRRGRDALSPERQALIDTASVLASTVVPPAKRVAAVISSGLTFAAVSDACARRSLLPCNHRGETHPNATARILAGT